MAQEPTITVIDPDGLRGVVEASRFSEEPGSSVLVQFEGGRRILVPVELLSRQEDGSYYLTWSAAELEQHEAEAAQEAEATVIPVIEEKLHLQKREVETGRVRITKVVHEEDEIVDLPLLEETVDVERVKINKSIDRPASIRQEDDVLIVPLHEEVLVVQKQLILREEIHIRKKSSETRRPRHVQLLSEEVLVERVDLRKEQGKEAS